MTRRELVALVLSAGAAAQSPAGCVTDPRLTRLTEFFHGRPAELFASRFLEESDDHRLDWRLLPSLAFVETGGGKRVHRANNWFGWNSGRARFATVGDAIHTVAEKLSESVLYRGKPLTAVLRIYNRHPSYPSRIRKVMEKIGPRVLETKDERRNEQHPECGEQAEGPGLGPGE